MDNITGCWHRFMQANNTIMEDYNNLLKHIGRCIKQTCIIKFLLKQCASLMSSLKIWVLVKMSSKLTSKKLHTQITLNQTFGTLQATILIYHAMIKIPILRFPNCLCMCTYSKYFIKSLAVIGLLSLRIKYIHTSCQTTYPTVLTL
jgi:hypothetical protein